MTDKDKRYVRFSDEAAIEYDRKQHQLTVNGGIEKIVIEVKTSITITAPLTTINSNIQVNGNINASGTIIDAGGNTNHHSH